MYRETHGAHRRSAFVGWYAYILAVGHTQMAVHVRLAVRNIVSLKPAHGHVALSRLRLQRKYFRSIGCASHSEKKVEKSKAQ